MNVISLDQVRQDRIEHLAALTADATRMVHDAIAYGHALAADATTLTAALPDPDRQLGLVVERFVLRRGLARSRQAWGKEYGRGQGVKLAKLASPIVTDAFWAKLDEIDPITCEVDGRIVPLVRGWRDASRRSA